jgi:hypothetical protein
MSLRVLILAAGESSRWENYRGTPKHLLVIDNETILHRTVRQVKQYTNDIVVVGRGSEHKVEGTTFFSPIDDTSFEMNKFGSSMEMWLENGKTVILFGDVYFSDEAIDLIMTNTEDWRFYLRPGPSNVTGKNCKEIFAITFDSSVLNLFKSAVTKLRDYKTSAAGWSLFRYLTLGSPSIPPNDTRMFNYGRHVVINDWTEDFDYPIDIKNWETNRSAKIKSETI